ncbi:hypothetical protein [Streptomyces anandii]|uniref:hypothetical protein n=1 Tax=Streptomyces anandii TaxID=285454 RepID=UPI003693C5CC
MTAVTAMASVCGVPVSALVIVTVVAVLCLRGVAVTVLPVMPVAPAVGAVPLPVTGVPAVTLVLRLAGSPAVALTVPLPRVLSVPPTACFGRRCGPLLLSR